MEEKLYIFIVCFATIILSHTYSSSIYTLLLVLHSFFSVLVVVVCSLMYGNVYCCIHYLFSTAFSFFFISFSLSLLLFFEALEYIEFIYYFHRHRSLIVYYYVYIRFDRATTEKNG